MGTPFSLGQYSASYGLSLSPGSSGKYLRSLLVLCGVDEPRIVALCAGACGG